MGITKVKQYITNLLLTKKARKLIESEEGKDSKFTVTMARKQPEQQLNTD